MSYQQIKVTAAKAAVTVISRKRAALIFFISSAPLRLEVQSLWKQKTQ